MAPFVITEDIRIMAIAVKEGYMPSEPVEFTYKVAETGEILEAELLTTLEIGDREYAVYTLPGKNGKIDILASLVVQDEEGFDKLVNIENQDDKEAIRKFLEETMLIGEKPAHKS